MYILYIIMLIRILLLNSICISYLCTYHCYYRRRPLEDLLSLSEVEELPPELFDDLDPPVDDELYDLLPFDDELRLTLSASLMSSSSLVSIGACVRVSRVGFSVSPAPLAGSCSSVGLLVGFISGFFDGRSVGFFVGFFDARSVGLSERRIVSE
jgi:hypothetical protein